jgi:TetR/AcrR family transcriptional regulator of autoinduction and epiphytic fitness
VSTQTTRNTDDGRLQRSVRTRDAVLNAFLALVEEGDLSPTAQQIAHRAQVSTRSVYHQFADVETIHELAGQLVFARVAAIPNHVDPTLPLNERVDTYVRYRIAIFDLIHPLSSAARVREPFSPVLQANRDGVLAMADANVRQVFAPELEGMASAHQDRLVAAISLATVWSSWYTLTEELQLDRPAAIAVMRASTRALIAHREQFS